MQLVSSEDCNVCPMGSYCIGGQTTVSGPCTSGHYCPEESSNPRDHPCPAGTYSSATNIFDISQVSILIHILFTFLIDNFFDSFSARTALLVIFVYPDPSR